MVKLFTKMVTNLRKNEYMIFGKNKEHIQNRMEQNYGSNIKDFMYYC